ncbi:hypothetical protein F5Y18DRAFT_346746 [Xylariaceae sp. FL1019]|nr:hypothetical protein F5Y18DRAFT_346746 [Xylariaceae sp. FL1019]
MEEGQYKCARAHERAQCLLHQVWTSPLCSRGAPSSMSYPPVSSIPTTSPERLTLASAETPSTTPSTILYLAYGSNLAAETFLGRRGIRPISQINVSAPAFDLTFDLPGIAYSEPCFANTRPRKLPKPPIPGDPPKFPPPPSQNSLFPRDAKNLLPALPGHGASWSKGLYGVVYEVTPEDYATIIKTEGGGGGYHDVLTPCIAFPPDVRVPEKPPIPDLPKPFLAHTLYAPALSDLPGGEARDGDGDGDKDPRNLPWYKRIMLPTHRPDGSQPSARYLKLLRDGAAEHALPEDYQEYLASLQPYTITTMRQTLGKFIFWLLALPVMISLLGLGRLLADENGRYPRWLMLATTAGINLLWKVYDVFLEPVFGDGERTMEEDEDAIRKRRERQKFATASRLLDEKSSLLVDW